MALFHVRAQVISRSAGRSAVAAAAYRAGEALYDAAKGMLHDYRRKAHVAHREILAPADAPDWMRDRTKLWNAVEAVEKRRDAQLAREIHIALPRELDAGQRLALVRAFVRSEFVARGMVADLVIHNPPAGDGKDQPHAHVMLTLRVLTGTGFGAKAREWNASGLYEAWRERWATVANRALERAGSPERIDHRSYADRGIDREAEPKLGPKAARLERLGGVLQRAHTEIEISAEERALLSGQPASALGTQTPGVALTERGRLWAEARMRNQQRARLQRLRTWMEAKLRSVMTQVTQRALTALCTRFAVLKSYLERDGLTDSTRPTRTAAKPTRPETERSRAPPLSPIPDQAALLGRRPVVPTVVTSRDALLGRIDRVTADGPGGHDRRGGSGPDRMLDGRDDGR